MDKWQICARSGHKIKMQKTYGCITHLELVGKVLKDKKKQMPNT
jgi:hypothetical protein